MPEGLAATLTAQTAQFAGIPAATVTVSLARCVSEGDEGTDSFANPCSLAALPRLRVGLVIFAPFPLINSALRPVL